MGGLNLRPNMVSQFFWAKVSGGARGERGAEGAAVPAPGFPLTFGANTILDEEEMGGAFQV